MDAAPFARMVDVVKRVRDGRDRRVVLDGVALAVGRGELVVLQGPSGSGKTTLLGLLGSMLRPTSGEVYLAGEPTSRLRDRHRAEVRRRAVGFLFQDMHLIDAMTALQNVLLPSVPEGTREVHVRRAAELLARFGLEGQRDVAAGALSGGERQRVALARALLLDPPLLLLDEPTAHVDDARAATMMVELADLASQGRALLVATHDPRVARHASVTRVLDLAAGRVRERAVSPVPPPEAA